MSGRSGVLSQDTLDFPLLNCSRLLLPPNPIPLSLSPLCYSNSCFLVIFDQVLQLPPGHQDQNLLRHGVRQRQRALRQSRLGETQRRSGMEILPAIDQRRRLLPQQRSFSLQFEARKFTPR
ncbi:hypothetical protein M0R45_017139 [Rubus argutus]|uniref:Uncharacterized protein n=1 Tax=Rubus argutus TaxID=59490 RepID=A0AAW1XWM5_RUBAR